MVMTERATSDPATHQPTKYKVSTYRKFPQDCGKLHEGELDQGLKQPSRVRTPLARDSWENTTPKVATIGGRRPRPILPSVGRLLLFHLPPPNFPETIQSNLYCLFQRGKRKKKKKSGIRDESCHPGPRCGGSGASVVELPSSFLQHKKIVISPSAR